MLLFEKTTSGWERFGILWNGAFFLWAAYLALGLHDVWGLFFMPLFGLFFLHAYYSARRKRDSARAFDAALKALSDYAKKE